MTNPHRKNPTMERETTQALATLKDQVRQALDTLGQDFSTTTAGALADVAHIVSLLNDRQDELEARIENAEGCCDARLSITEGIEERTNASLDSLWKRHEQLRADVRDLEMRRT